MHEGKRPGGLTALAIFNFIGAGLDAFGIISVIGLAVFGGKLADMMERDLRKEAAERARAEGRDPDAAEIAPEERDAITALRLYEGDHVTVGLQVAGLVACAGLLLAAGVGYLRQRRWARIVGNIYVFVSVASAIHDMGTVPPEYGGGFRFAALLGFVYPVVTAYLLNLTFREDLRR